MQPNAISTAGIVLRTNASREADLVLSLLTKELGRVSAYVRQAKGSKKKYFSGVDLFDCGVFELDQANKGSDLKKVLSFSAREHWTGLRENLSALTYGYYCLELTLQFTQDDEPDSKELFSPLFNCLRALNSAKSSDELTSIAAFYNLIILKVSGYNIVDDLSQPINAHTLCWFTAMLSHSSPVVPFNKEIITPGLMRLKSFSQDVTGRKLHTLSL